MTKIAIQKLHLLEVIRARHLSILPIVFVLIFAVAGVYWLFSTHATALVGDINGDGVVNIFDLSLLLSSYNKNQATCVTDPAYTCDLNGDGVVNIFDLSILLSNYERTAPLVSSPLPIPVSVPVSQARYGFNVSPNVSYLADMKAAGATIARWQPGWSSVEDYSTGDLALPSAYESALTYSGQNGIQTINVCGYGPPYSNVFDLTVGGAGAKTGDYTIPINGSVSGVQTPLDYVMLSGNQFVTAPGKWGYYGSLIDSVDTSNNTITLASALTTNLPAGTELIVNRLRYASPADQSLTNPSLVAYFRYCQFVASQIAADGDTGWVSIWNEPPWTHDPWDARGKFYDSWPNLGGINVPLGTTSATTQLTLSGTTGAPGNEPAGTELVLTDPTKTHSQTWTLSSPSTQGDLTLQVESQTANFAYPSGSTFQLPQVVGMNNDTRMKMFLQYAMNINNMPNGVRIINDTSDKTGGDGLIWQGLNPTSTTVSENIDADSIHPYGNLPDTFMWDPNQVNSADNGYALLNPTVDVNSNFDPMAFMDNKANIGLNVIATEVGYADTDDTRQAIWLTRRVATSWAANVTPVLFEFTDNASGQNIGVWNASTNTPRLAYTALQRMMDLVNGLGGSGGSTSSVPSFLGYSGGQWPPYATAIYGKNGTLLLVWQRTGADTSTTWDTIPTPPTYAAELNLPAGSQVVSDTDVITGQSVPTSVNGQTLTLDAVGEDVQAVLLKP